MKAEEGRT